MLIKLPTLCRATAVMAAAASVALWHGVALAQFTSNVTLLSNIDQHGFYNDVWGYTAPGGDEIAIIGTNDGTAFYDVTVPGSPLAVGFIDGPNSTWRDMKTYSHYCYIVTEGTLPEEDSGIQVVDLSDPQNPALVNTVSGFFARSHNVFIDVDAGRAYVVGGASDFGTFIFDLAADPEDPPLLGVYDDLYIHDIYVKNNTAYAAHINNNLVGIYDVTDPTDWQLINSWTYPQPIATHNTWVDGSESILVTTDETAGGHLQVWDISNPTSQTLLDDYVAPPPLNGAASIHNAYIRGDYCYMSYYTEGFNVVSIADPSNVVVAGYYDTYVPLGLFDGAWGCYPFAARPGIVYISDTENGLFVLDFEEARVGIETPGDASTPVLTLQGNAPNPFNPRTSIRFELPSANSVTLRIYDTSGRHVRTLIDGSLAAGAQVAVWDGLDAAGRPMGSGVYFYRLEAGTDSRSSRMVLAR